MYTILIVQIPANTQSGDICTVLQNLICGIIFWGVLVPSVKVYNVYQCMQCELHDIKGYDAV